MSANDDLRKVRFTEDDGHVECVWAEPLGDDRYRIDNTPWFAYGVSWKDIVEAKVKEEGDLPDFIRVVEKSGHRTVRLILEEEEERKRVLKRLCDLGCTYEGSNGRFFGIDIPPCTNLTDVTTFLSSMEHHWEHADPRYSELYPDAK